MTEGRPEPEVKVMGMLAGQIEDEVAGEWRCAEEAHTDYALMIVHRPPCDLLGTKGDFNVFETH